MARLILFQSRYGRNVVVCRRPDGITSNQPWRVVAVVGSGQQETRASYEPKVCGERRLGRPTRCQLVSLEKRSVSGEGPFFIIRSSQWLVTRLGIDAAGVLLARVGGRLWRWPLSETVLDLPPTGGGDRLRRVIPVMRIRTSRRVPTVLTGAAGDGVAGTLVGWDGVGVDRNDSASRRYPILSRRIVSGLGLAM